MIITAVKMFRMNMWEVPGVTEYIEREALLAAYDKAHKGPPGEARKLIEEAPAVKILFLCDCRQCERCGRSPCAHTTNIAHARNFEKKFGDLWVEFGDGTG